MTIAGVDWDAVWFFVEHAAVEEAVVQKVLRILAICTFTVVIGLDLEL